MALDDNPWEPDKTVSPEEAETHEWNYLGSQRTQDGARRIYLPEGVFEAGILKQPTDDQAQKVYWSYENGAGLTIISDQELTDRPIFKDINSTKIQDEEGGYYATIPSNFFEDSEGRTAADERVDEEAWMDYGEEYHFITRKEMMESTEGAEKKSAYLVDKIQLSSMIGNYRDLESTVAEVPNFLRE